MKLATIAVPLFAIAVFSLLTGAYLNRPLKPTEPPAIATNEEKANIFKLGFYSGMIKSGDTTADEWAHMAAGYLEHGEDREFLRLIQEEIKEIQEQKQEKLTL